MIYMKQLRFWCIVTLLLVVIGDCSDTSFNKLWCKFSIFYSFIHQIYTAFQWCSCRNKCLSLHFHIPLIYFFILINMVSLTTHSIYSIEGRCSSCRNKCISLHFHFPLICFFFLINTVSLTTHSIFSIEGSRDKVSFTILHIYIYFFFHSKHMKFNFLSQYFLSFIVQI